MPPKRRRKKPPATESPKPCKDCGSTTRPRKYPGPRCTTCHRLKVKENKGRSRNSYLVNTYGITEQEYLDIKRHQDGRCFICRRATGATKNLAVDHDHAHCAGKKGCRECVRGLLCSSCNQGVLGHLRDDIESVKRILEYLTDPPARKVLDDE